MSKDMTPLLFDGWKIEIQMTDGNKLTLYKEHLPEELSRKVENVCRDHFDTHYDEMITKHREG